MIKKIIDLFLRKFSSPNFYARYSGVKVGKNCFIAPTNKYWGTEPYLIEIGNNVQVTHNVHFHTHGGGQIVRRKHPKFDCFGKIKIEDWAYIGAESQIMPGVTIGEGALVAAGSIVTKSVAPNTVVGGNPARFICTTDEYIERNLKYNLNSKGLSFEQKKQLLLSLPEDKFIRK